MAAQCSAHSWANHIANSAIITQDAYQAYRIICCIPNMGDPLTSERCSTRTQVLVKQRRSFVASTWTERDRPAGTEGHVMQI